MCCWSKNQTSEQVSRVYNSEGEIETDDQNTYESNLPQHADYALLNTDVLSGILGFHYETKDTVIVIYSTVETKTFCYIMQLKPIPS